MLIEKKNNKEKYFRAKKFYENGLLKKAKELFIELTINDPSIWQNWFSLGAIHQQEKNYKQAIKSYNLAIILNTKNAFSYFHLAECSLSINEKTNALKALDLAKKHCGDKNLETQIQILKEQNK